MNGNMSTLECATEGCGKRKLGIAARCGGCLSNIASKISPTALAKPGSLKESTMRRVQKNLDMSMGTGMVGSVAAFWAFSKFAEGIAGSQQLAIAEPETKPALPPRSDDTLERDLMKLKLREITKTELVEAFVRLKKRSMRKDGDRLATSTRRALDREIETLRDRITALELTPRQVERVGAGVTPTDTNGDAYQILGKVSAIPAGSWGDIRISPTVSPYFEPKAISMKGLDSQCPGTNLRFTIGDVGVGGCPQMATGYYDQTGAGATDGSTEILSDVFSGENPVPVNWMTISTPGLARELVIRVFNPNPMEMKVFTTLWGNVMDRIPDVRSPFG